jgi:hypothetical protein
MRFLTALRAVLSTSLVLGSLGGCVATDEPGEGSDMDCGDGKCDEVAAMPSCTALPSTGLRTAIFPAATEPNTFLYVPDQFKIERIATHLPVLNVDALTAAELQASPFVSRPSIRFDVALTAAESEDVLRAAIRRAASIEGPITLQPVPLSTPEQNPLTLRIFSPSAEPVMTSQRTGALTYAAVAQLPPDRSGVALLEAINILQARAGISSISLAATMSCLDQTGTRSTRAITPQSSKVALTAAGIELENGPDVVEGASRLVSAWITLDNMTDWAAGFGHPMDLSAAQARSRALVSPITGYGDGVVTVAQVQAAGSAAQAELRAAYAIALASFAVSTPDIAAHLTQVGAGGSTLTPLDSYFAAAYVAAGALATFTPAIAEVLPFAAE